MARAWPFEKKPEANVRSFRRPADYARHHGEGTEAVVVRIGKNDTQLVLVAPPGDWDRWVYHSWDEAVEVAGTLGVPVHENEYPEPLRVRMNAYQRPAEDFDASAYPEVGGVGGFNPYPENRPRRVESGTVDPEKVHDEAQT